MFLRRSGIEETDKNEIFDKSVLSTCGKQIMTANMMHTYLFLHSLASFQQEKARELLDLITAEELAEIYKEWFKKGDYTILELVNIRQITTKLQNEEFWLNFINQFTEEEIVDLLNNSHHRQSYSFFRRRLSTNARQAHRLFLDQYTEEEILSQLKSLDLKQIGEFVHMHYWHRTVKKAYEKFFVDFLPGKIDKASLEDITKFITIIGRTRWKKKPLIGNKLSIQVINNLSEDFIRQKLEESSLNGIQSFIRISKKVNKPEILKLIKSLEQSKLKDKIRESDINDIGYFIWNISDDLSLPVEYRAIITDLDLTEKIRKSPLKDVNFFLWVLFQTAGELKRVFSEDIQGY
jgi:hypothetical protein